jgi:hypothetical protein
MDAQPLLVVNCCDFVTGDDNIVSLCKCFLHLLKDHVGKSMRNLPACQLIPVLARLMRDIESIIQLLACTIITHGAAKLKQMKHSAKLNHFFLTLLYKPSNHFVQNTLTSPCVIDLLVLDVLVLSHVVILPIFELHRMAQCFTSPSMLPQEVDLRNQ